jgi:hypothetical protein
VQTEREHRVIGDTTTKPKRGEKILAAFGVISKNVLAEKQTEVDNLLDQLDAAMNDLSDKHQEASHRVSSRRKGNAKVHESQAPGWPG